MGYLDGGRHGEKERDGNSERARVEEGGERGAERKREGGGRVERARETVERKRGAEGEREGERRPCVRRLAVQQYDLQMTYS